MCPWADVLYAMDAAWWQRYLPDVKKEFKGKFFAGVSGVKGVPIAPSKTLRNSGAGAINLAAHLGAKNIVLLGYDCQHTGGKTHWHGNHPKGLGNAGKVNDWPAQFATLAIKLSAVNIINCTRNTRLNCWPKKSLEETLCAL